MRLIYWILIALWLFIIPRLCLGQPLASTSFDEPSFSSPSDGALGVSQATIVPEPFETYESLDVVTIADPLEPMNRAFFHFNDKLYFWVLKPVASGYKAIIPQPARVCVRNFFSNVATPIRLVNCLLQANFNCGGTEIARFFLNTTIGVAGLFDPAKTKFNIEKQEEDFGQTMGVWGMGPLFYINWPLLGPSSLRDTIGFVADGFLEPQYYLITSIPIHLSIRSYKIINETSLTIGEYEDLKDAALDPYGALKDAYFQYRRKKIKER